MSASERRKSRIRAYPIPMVEQAIAATVYGKKNQDIVRDIFVGDTTYEEAAWKAGLTPSGLHKKMQKIMPPVEDYLHSLN